MFKMRYCVIAAMVCFFALSAKQSHALPMFPDPISFAYQYGDFYSYSLPMLDYLDDGSDYASGSSWYTPAPTGPIVIYTNANNVSNNPAGMDDSYKSIPGSSSFSTTVAPDPAPGSDPPFTGDSPLYWDTEITALQSYLNGSDLFFFFNNAQKQNTDADGFPEANLFAWGQVIIRDTASENPLADLYFDFTDINTGNDVTAYSNSGGTGPVNPYISTAEPGDFVLSGSTICLGTQGNIVDCNGTDVVKKLKHNVGSNAAAYSIFSPEINDNLGLWFAEGYDLLSFDIRLEHLNNGPEEFFILPATAYRNSGNVESIVLVVTPEPGTFLLVGVGLLGLGFLTIKRRKS